MENLKKIFELLKKAYPDTKTALQFNTPFQLLIATVLSAQTTDTQVNKITKDLFKKFPGPKEFADAKIQDIEKSISSINFYKTKAANIKKLSEKIEKDFNGKVPDSMDKLITLPGVARKTANVVLSQAFGKNQGIVVDTHVKRVSNRLGLTKNTDPDKIEKDLMRIIPEKEWGNFSFRIIQHGRKVCKAKNPLCNECVLSKICPSYNQK
ncbi:MAG TPA: endonuclease III [Candidatus Ratteibacteria bacterium]|jgi:endonuclease-3|uniref:Endonuclease III n=1 Tax=candidate division TA06 bacterium ADurb.Bin131 TaxID=1852827 RepID=A0A1V6CC07_UNCT6|nr:MAG: Ultraviolet N-glycosylase/AP lyase [candidate division TA06 bacterium ADurb.Bin131]HOC02990.1 endonuclease III [bacterium]HON05599.1 endonuclease III [bacterium]HRS06569.1 endonuclease III [Candidatus Ratteibacteria bacterium]HRV04492.1 endonuclease III [Candidatus Ratteibacteria bacterium]